MGLARGAAAAREVDVGVGDRGGAGAAGGRFRAAGGDAG